MLNKGDFVKIIRDGKSDSFGEVLGTIERWNYGTPTTFYTVKELVKNTQISYERKDLVFVNPEELIDISLDNKDREEFMILTSIFCKELLENA